MVARGGVALVANRSPKEWRAGRGGSVWHWAVDVGDAVECGREGGGIASDGGDGGGGAVVGDE